MCYALMPPLWYPHNLRLQICDCGYCDQITFFLPDLALPKLVFSHQIIEGREETHLLEIILLIINNWNTHSEKSFGILDGLWYKLEFKDFINIFLTWPIVISLYQLLHPHNTPMKYENMVSLTDPWDIMPAPAESRKPTGFCWWRWFSICTHT